VYLSNESSEPVYFDNFKVEHKRGHIIEENHYYAYGLRIAALSSRKLGDINEGHLKNNYLFQGDFNEFDEDLGWNQFALRDYDPQIGRFVQQDPYQQFHSPYTGMGDDPIDFIDPSGGFSLASITGSSNLFLNTVVATAFGAMVGGIVDFVTGGNGRGALIGSGVGLSVGLASGINWGGAGSVVRSAEPELAMTSLNGARQFAAAPYTTSPNLSLPATPGVLPNMPQINIQIKHPPNIQVAPPKKESVSSTKKNFGLKEATTGLQAVYKKYGKEMAETVERMYRMETNHFKSGQYRNTGTGGMEVFGSDPYYGWDPKFFKANPQYTPEGIYSAYEGKGLSGIGGNQQVTNRAKRFVVMPSVEAGMMFKANYINRYNGNY
ncbi:MAG: hypothetical protein EOO89_30810, partial [Pedobacter sp.]